MIYTLYHLDYSLQSNLDFHTITKGQKINGDLWCLTLKKDLFDFSKSILREISAECKMLVEHKRGIRDCISEMHRGL